MQLKGDGRTVVIGLYSSGTYTGTGSCLDALETCGQCLADENYDGYMPNSFYLGVRMSDDRGRPLQHSRSEYEM